MGKSNQPAPWVRTREPGSGASPDGRARTELAEAQRNLLRLFAWSFVVAIAAGLVTVVILVVYSMRATTAEERQAAVEGRVAGALDEVRASHGDAAAAEAAQRTLQGELADERARSATLEESLKASKAALAAIEEQDRNPGALRRLELHELLGEDPAMKLVVVDPISDTAVKGITREVVEQVARQRAKTSALRVDDKVEDVLLTVSVLYVCNEEQTHCAVSVGAFLDTFLRAPPVGDGAPAHIGVQLWGSHRLDVGEVDSDLDVRDLISEAVASLFNELYGAITP